uniref:Acyl carrier protein n=1 Tax=Dasya binghamiae TaxID=1896963 RepID=A0A1C8XS40_9FLOR|nr:acyl carrier protein [Dasya binghamiae]AOH77311.1 acyl carrier protein [Dasya binghamiae]
MSLKADSSIFDRVKQIVTQNLSVEPEKVTKDAIFIDDLGADSLDTVELVMAIEEVFDIEIPDEAAEEIRTLSDAVNYIEKAIKDKKDI